MSPLEQVKEMFSDQGEPPLPYERWASVAPRLVARDDEFCRNALKKEEIDAALWERANVYWSLTLAEESAAGKPDRALAYGDACAQDMKKRASEQPISPSPIEAVSEVAAAAPTPPMVATSFPEQAPSLGTEEAKPATYVPSYLRPSDSAGPGAPVLMSSPGPVPEQAAVIGPPALEPPAEPAAPAYGQTTEVDVAAILRASTPFPKRSPAAASPTPPAVASPSVPTASDSPPPGQMSTGTGEIDLSKILKTPVPFDKRSPSGPVPEKPKSEKTQPIPAAPEPASPAPTGRLVRFDPRTGQPLAVPYWEELKSAQDSEKKG